VKLVHLVGFIIKKRDTKNNTPERHNEIGGR